MSLSHSGSIHVVTKEAKFNRGFPSSISSSLMIWYAASFGIEFSGILNLICTFSVPHFYRCYICLINVIKIISIITLEVKFGHILMQMWSGRRRPTPMRRGRAPSRRWEEEDKEMIMRDQSEIEESDEWEWRKKRPYGGFLY